MVDLTYSVLTRAFRLTGSVEMHSIRRQTRLSCFFFHYIFTLIRCCAIITRSASSALALVNFSAIQGCNRVHSLFAFVTDTVDKPELSVSF